MSPGRLTHCRVHAQADVGVGGDGHPQRAGVPAVVHTMHTPDDDVLIPFFIIELSP